MTGATGFLGRELVRALHAEGWQVRALARRDTTGLFGEAEAPEITRGSLEDADALARLCDGADVVIHAAGLVKAPNRAAFDSVNVAGAERLAAAAERAGVGHFLLVSSLAAREPGLSHYSGSKAAGEAVVLASLPGRVSIVRPCAIYGPGDRELLPVFQAAAFSPILPVLSAKGRVAMIHVADAARQTAAVAGWSPDPTPLELSDSRPDGYTWAELMAVGGRTYGRRPALVSAPAGVLRLIAGANDLLALTGQSPMLTSAKARELLHPDWGVSPDPRRGRLPPCQFDLETGFADTAAWYRSAAWLKQ